LGEGHAFAQLQKLRLVVAAVVAGINHHRFAAIRALAEG
jgi:hypothetical protein